MAFLRGERELNLFLWDGDTLHVWGEEEEERRFLFWGEDETHFCRDCSGEKS